tara:strand:+ start:1250 stop:1525 length:276 start_codon:yes stop_codon:yes gene_type:complete
MKRGDLIQMSDGRFATVVRGDYTFRFMEIEDYEMESNGMGEYAGIYGTAIDVVFTDSGYRQRLSVSKHNFTVIDSVEDKIAEIAMSLADGV